GRADGFVGRRMRGLLPVRRRREDPHQARRDAQDGYAVMNVVQLHKTPRRMGQVNVPKVTMSHGGGGKAMRDLIDDVFISAFDNETLATMEDQARFRLADLAAYGDRLAMTTDSYVIHPLKFPGGDIGKLAVCGTVNDLAVGGAKPLYLSCAAIIEEGLPVETLRQVARSM